MDRGKGRKRLHEPLLPIGANNLFEIIEEENFPQGFENYFNAENGEFDSSHTITTTASHHGDFTTSTSSPSAGSFIGSSISDNSTSEHSAMPPSTQQSFSISGHYQQRFPGCGSSSSLHSSSSLPDCLTMSNPVTQRPLQEDISSPFGLHDTHSGFLIDKSSYNNSCVGAAGVLSDFSTTSEEDNDPLNIEPTIPPVPNFDFHDYLHNLNVEFKQINRIFEKAQSRKDKKARQRIVDGKVKIVVTSDKPIAELRVWVRREPQAATLCNDKNGEVELKKPTLLRHMHNQWVYVVDLDSVYQGQERPVYELAKVEMNERNMFEILAQVVFKNSEISDKIISKPFLIRTLKRTVPDDGQKNKNKWPVSKKMAPMYRATMLYGQPQLVKYQPYLR